MIARLPKAGIFAYLHFYCASFSGKLAGLFAFQLLKDKRRPPH